MKLSTHFSHQNGLLKTTLPKIVASFTRTTSTAKPRSEKLDSLAVASIAESAEGILYASLPLPACWSGLTRLVAVVNAGSRYESSSNLHGIGHLLRRSFGLSTNNYTAVNLTRHIQQMGADFRCTSTRDHLIYSADVAPNLAPRASNLLAHMASQTAFYEWELKDQAYKLMQKDIDVVNRRKLDALAMELLYEAAFGRHPDGNGLGNSLYASADQLGNFSFDAIMDYINRRYTPSNVAFVVSGSGPSSDGLELCETMKDAFHFNSKLVEKKNDIYGLVGGEIRRNLKNSAVTHAALAWPTPGSEDIESVLALSLISRALQASIQHVSYATTKSLLNPESGEDCDLACSAPLFHFHPDVGLFGVFVTGCCGKAVSDRVVYSREQLGALADKGLSEIQFERAKMRLKSDILMRASNQFQNTNDVAVQLLSQRSLDYQSSEEAYSAVDKLILPAVNKVFKGVLSSKKASLTVVGLDAHLTPPLSALVNT